MAMMKKAAAKKSDPSKTKPFNVQLIKPSEIVKDKAKAKPAPKKTATPKTTPKAPAKTTPKMTPQDAAMLKLLKKKYGADVYKG